MSAATPMRLLTVAFTLLAFMISPMIHAEPISIPKDDPAATVEVPKSWKPEETDHGYAIESPDQVATIILEATTKKGLDTLIDENIEWLTKDQGVKVDGSTKAEKEFELGGRTWSRISWDANNKEFGPSIVGFMFTAVGKGKVLTITYWITKKDAEKHLEVMEKIFSSVKPVE